MGACINGMGAPMCRICFRIVVIRWRMIIMRMRIALMDACIDGMGAPMCRHACSHAQYSTTVGKERPYLLQRAGRAGERRREGETILTWSCALRALRCVTRGFSGSRGSSR
jgi:hypothetical protein